MATIEDIRTSYDVGNDFFRLWLDEAMNYSCAVWRPGDSLQAAQDRKLDVIHDFAGISAASTVLDIGCGWGANLQRMVEHRGVRSATGITLSAAQRQEVLARGLPGVEVELVDYRDLQPARPFDAVTSICMFEHIATPEQARHGQHVDVFRDFFGRVHGWTRPGARFAMQTILIDRLPRDRHHIREMAEVTAAVLPGSKCARLHEVVKASGAHWELQRLVTRRPDYVRTLREWHRRLVAHEPVIRERWGDRVFAEYERYLRGCAVAFDRGYLTVAQISFRRVDGKDRP